VGFGDVREDIREAVREAKGGCYLNVIVTPGSKKSGIKGYNGWRKAVEVSVKSPPKGGKANSELEKLLSEILNCRTEVVKGHTSQHKVVFAECGADFARKRIAEILRG